MRDIRYAVSFFCVFLAAAPLWADEVRLKNGDKISGKILLETPDSLTVETRAMGMVVIKKDYIMVDEPVTTEISNTVNRETPRWVRNISLGYSQSGGNTEKSQGTAAVNINRKTADDEWSIKGESYYASSDNKIDTRKYYGQGRYAYSFGRHLKWYHFYKLEGDQDRFANVDYRIIPSSGVGYWFSDTDDFKAMLESALGYSYTRYRGNDNVSEAVLLPRAYIEKELVKNLRVKEDINLYPSLEEIGEFRLRSESALIHNLSEQLSWKISFIDEYHSDPRGTAKKNDYRVITAIDYAF